MKLIIQIPCLNEAETLPGTLADLPREVEGFDTVEWLVIDDGSTDDTARVAQDEGVDHVVTFPNNRGLAKAFMAGLERAIDEGADVIVNTDADNQYCGEDLAALVQPILEDEADMVIGERPVGEIQSFSPIKKLLQKIGSWVVRVVSGTHVQDAPSGFRAFTRKAAKQINVFDKYTYTLETIIQAGHKGIAIVNVPVRVNAPTRESRLIRSIPSYIQRSVFTMVRVALIYRAMRFFSFLSLCFFTPGVILGIRFVHRYLEGGGAGMIQSLLLATLLMGTGFLLFVVGILADLIAVNRRILERLQSRIVE